MKQSVYPFVALVGQEELKLGLLLNAINPAVGGILIRGEKGTAKSTAVRGLAELLPEIEVVAGCRFSCDPERPEDFCSDCRQSKEKKRLYRKARLVELPLNATEDRVAGGIDFARAIQTGEPQLDPGLLATAHRSILYVDEVNLLDDHIVDLIVDAAASGRNVVEREGISYNHPAQVMLVGTMNPEEGDLRSQLLDRFGLCVEVSSSNQLDERIELLLRREAYDQDSSEFISLYQEKSELLGGRIAKAQKRLATVQMPSHMRSFISELCATNNVAGHRADLVMEQAAKALAAYEGLDRVKSEHIARVSPMVLLHRLREMEEPPPPPEDEPSQREESEKQEDKQNEPERDTSPEIDENSDNEAQPKENDSNDENEKQEPQESEESQPRDDDGGGTDTVFDVGEPFKVRSFTAEKDRLARRGSGRRSRSRISQKQGRYIKAAQNNGKIQDIALDATIRAAAPFQKSRRSGSGRRNGQLAVHLSKNDVRVKIREKRIGNLLLFIVDGSGSMGARGRMVASKSAVMSLLLDAYQKRDKVAMVTFRRREAHVHLPVTNSVELAGRLLSEMPVGGRTPLSAGLVKGYEMIRNYLIREPSGKPIVIILTDGKTNVSLGEEKPVDEMVRLATAMSQEERAKYIVVDTEEEGLVTFDLARQLAATLGGEYFKTKDLRAGKLVSLIREQQ